ncbi:MAG: penicillin-binding protein 1C [Saprospiraceae bacterium]|nr:penicillin-binding protein 1C [Saprospiraceae bacterium]
MQKIHYIFLGFIAFLFAALIWADSLVPNIQYSPVLFSKSGKILSMKTASDGQWRYKPDTSIPIIFEKSLLEFEDKNFYEHLGIDPVGIVRAFYLNVKNKKIVSGGSTITMQLARLYLKSGKRNIFSKILEAFLAIGLELRFSKKEILRQYSSMAPLGANVVGIEAAMFRYYNKNISDLSWAEASLFAVLPNQPSWLHLAKNRLKLLEKRNKLLSRLNHSGFISKDDYQLSLLEPLPEKPAKVQRLAPHALDYLLKKYPDESNFFSTIDDRLQSSIQEIVIRHHELLRQNEIRNASILLIDNKTQEVVSYIGNILFDTIKAPFAEVNMIHAPRSSGSVLKPLLVASAIDKGMVIKNSLVPDIPVVINGFRPENFSRTYTGACTVQELIRNSLNIPSILLLKELGVPVFYSELEKLQFTSLFRKPMEYGLALILGGAEITMWDLCRAYSYLMYSQQNYDKHRHKYISMDSFKIKFLRSEFMNESKLLQDAPIFTAGSISDMFQTMRNPIPGNSFIETDKTLQNIAWKTGTSFGYKDAWCIGINPDYTLAVWVGNSNGLPRPGLIGLETAAPMMFEIMNTLSVQSEWLPVYDNKSDIAVCRESGYKAGEFCNTIDTVNVSASAFALKNCPYHQNIYLDKSESFQVFANCEINYIEKNYFILPPVMAHYYKQKNAHYSTPPAVRPDCLSQESDPSQVLEFIYPNHRTDIVIPIDLDEKRNSVIFKAVHKDPNASVFWFLDNAFLGKTKGNHEITSQPEMGDHWLVITDENGHFEKVKFVVRR